MKIKKYSIGNKIGNDWIIVAELEVHNQNKKLLCYNPQLDLFKEGWIWDFYRDLVTNKPNKNPSCVICKIDMPDEDMFDLNADYAFKCLKANTIISGFTIKLRNIREGLIGDIPFVLKIFADMLSQSGQSRRNKKLAVLIHSTYKILYYRNYFDQKIKREE